MPKDRRARSVSFERCSRASPYPCSSSSTNRSSSHPGSTPEFAVADKDAKKWEEVRCPVCMEHPHNAVLLLCSSRDKGCRPFMCDTSYRHSNCLDQYRKAFAASKQSEGNDEAQQKSDLSCPLCRGLVTGWTVEEAARCYMNSKARSCSKESCSFTGAYGELRKHARKEHPSERPSEVDPERQRDWRRMEQQRDLGDLFSMFRSGVSGDDDGFGVSENEEDSRGRVYAFPSVTVFLVIQGVTGMARSALRYTRSSLRGLPRRSRRGMILWGETLSELDTTDGASNNSSSPGDNDGEDNAISEDAPGSFSRASEGGNDS
ncbi:uncharacterized protein [Typha latifolia]|uniref:uncharacterized protein n=1 Tax=Typha latifolia TaxID=4733 RepID=UPI003C2E8BFA